MMDSMWSIDCVDWLHHIAIRERDVLVKQVCFVGDFWQLDLLGVGE